MQGQLVKMVRPKNCCKVDYLKALSLKVELLKAEVAFRITWY